MENDVILYMTYAVLYVVGAGILAFAGKHTVAQLKAFALELVPYLRRVFDPGSIVVKILESRGIKIDRAQADKLLEAIADAAEKVLAAPAQEVNIPAPLNEKPL